MRDQRRLTSSEPVDEDDGRAEVAFTRTELFTLYEALESYWFDCSQGGDEELAGKRPAIEALSAKIEIVLVSHSE